MNKLETLLALCDCQHFYHMNSGLDRAAKCLAEPTFDPNAVHYTRERIVSRGYEEIATTSKGQSKDHLGKVRKDERTGISFRPIQHAVVDEFYKTPQVQESEWKRNLATLLVGQRITRDLQGVRKETVTMLGEAWPLGLTNIRAEKAIKRLQQSPLLQDVPLASPSRNTRKTAAERLGGQSGK
jgi:hypothetical protein